MTCSTFHRWAAVPLTTFALVLAGCSVDAANGQPPASTDAAPAASAPAASEASAGLPLRVVVVGDSNTTGFKTTLADGIDSGLAWIAMVPQSDIKYAGGWAHNGATSTAMREAVTPVPDADVLVMMAGTNNIAMGLPKATLEDDLRAISATVGAAHTVVAAIAPFDARPDDAVVLNAQLAALAAAEGWTYVDPWVDLRSADGTWVQWYRVDGLHANREGYQAMALAMHDALLARFAAGATPAP